MKHQDYLSETGVSIFKKIVSHLRDKGVTDAINTYELSMLSNSLDLYARAALDIKNNGYDQDNKRSGGKVMTPAYNIMKIEYSNILKHSPKFGLNPTDMAKLAENLPKPKDEADLLKDLMTISST